MDPARLTRLIDRVAESAPAPNVILAYHGSPYDFDRFDASKIGTGEGNQTFGYGHYLAENEDVAKHYRDNVGPNYELPVPEELSKELQRTWDAYDAISRRHSEWSVANSGGGVYRPNPLDADRDAAIAAWQAVRSKIDSATAPPPGRVYEVEVAHPESALLDLDALASEQSPAVRGALSKLGFKTEGDLPPRHRIGGHTLVRRLQDDLSPPGASQTLFEAGIPGLRYFDQDSRVLGTGTRNYVIFPGAEDQIRILRKYGMLAPIPAAAAMGGGTED